MLRTLGVLLAVLALGLLVGCGEPVPLDTTAGAAVTDQPQLRPSDTTTTAPPPTTTTTAVPTTTTTAPPPATTTTMPPSPPPPPVTPASSWGAEGHVNGYPCGGQLPTCAVLDCESGGNPTAENPSSTASGLWQILDSTWAGFGGYSHASYAPPDVQNQKAVQLWAGGAGRSHWAQCL